MSLKSGKDHYRASNRLAKSQTLNKECDVISNEIGYSNAELELKELEINLIKRNLDQERLIKEAAIRRLTLTLANNSMAAERFQLSAEADAFNDRRKRLLKRHLMQQKREENLQLQSMLAEYEKRLQKKEIQLAALNDQATRLIRTYQRNRLEIEALHLGITTTPSSSSSDAICTPLPTSDLVVGSTDVESNEEKSKLHVSSDASIREFSF